VSAGKAIEERHQMVLRPISTDDQDELLRILATPEVRQWWDAPPENFP
jgi:hypothetical protein